MSKTPCRILLLMVLGMTMFGCGQSAPEKKGGAATTTTTTTSSSKDDGAKAGGSGTTTSGSTTATTPETKTATATTVKTADVASFLTDDVVGLAVVNPRRLTEWPLYKLANETGVVENLVYDRSMLELLGLPAKEIERLTVVIDQSEIDKGVAASGLGADSPKVAASTARNNLKQIGIAFHNYHDAHNAFPRHDGDADGEKIGLSWRVHLLPMFGEGPLYNEFNLDEPWDSEHNKALIEKMPEIYQTPGVMEAGKTAVHVFKGKGTPFDGDKGKKLSDFTDGTSNTILAVVAGADTADVWTKPGGLALDPKTPIKALGTIEGPDFTALFADGSVHSIPVTVEPTQLANLVQLGDGNIIADFGSEPSRGAPPEQPMPTVIAQLVKSANRKAIVDALIPPVPEQQREEMKKYGVTMPSAKEESHEGQSFTHDDHSAIWFVNDTTFVLSSVDGVKKAITANKSGKPGAQKLVARNLDTSADMAVVFDVASQAKLVQKGLENAPPIPGVGMAAKLQLFTAQLNLTGASRGKLLAVTATMSDEAAATDLNDLGQGLLEFGKKSLDDIPLPPALSDDEKSAVKVVLDTARSATLKQDGSKVEFVVTVADGFDNLPALLKPALEKARAVAKARTRLNNLKQLALGFHNYHDTHGSFPGAGHAAQSKTALSWRVHLLPYIDAGALYNEFKLDEPWDSEHNKALIAKMPDVFKAEGVTEPGKTTLHVFTGKGSPFADDTAPKLFAITDGTSNTILAVEAGADTAEIWTKPGGLDFDPKDPIKALGKLSEEIFRVVMCDGAARSLPITINPDTLRKLIQANDGEPVEF